MKNNKVLVLGASATVLSGAGTSIFPYVVFVAPIVLLLVVLSCRTFLRSPVPRVRTAPFGIALAFAALSMPLAAGAGLWVFSWFDRRAHPVGPITVGEPLLFAMFTPAVIVLVVPLVIVGARDVLRTRR